MSAVVVLIVTPFLLFSALIGYLLYCGQRCNHKLGVITILVITVGIVFFAVGLPREIITDSNGQFLELWTGFLFTYFQKPFLDCFHWFYSLLNWKWDYYAMLRVMTNTRYLLWASIFIGMGFGIFLNAKKNWKIPNGFYLLLKAPLDLWLYFLKDTKASFIKKLLYVIAQCCALVLVKIYLLPHIYDAPWVTPISILFIIIGAITGIGAVVFGETSHSKDTREKIQIGKDGTSLTSKQLNHHVHVLGESGFGKSVFLMRLITHHIRHGEGLIFIDLKADIDTVSYIAELCKLHDRIKDLRLFDCSNPELSLPYNVLLSGNATEIKDKLIGSFSWESTYYKGVAENFLLSVTNALVFLRDNHHITFTLDDLYQATLTPDALVALQEELNLGDAPEKLREDINDQAHFLRGRDSYKDLQGLRTQIKLLIDSEFGSLLTSSECGIDLFESIRSHQIVYILLDSQRYGESAKKLGKLILQDLKSASGRIISEIPKNERTPCTIIVDEFADLATEQFVGLLNRARGSGLGIIVAHQEMSDLETFSPTMRDQVMGNTATTVSFLQKMPESAERLAAIAGTKTAVKSTRQLQQEGFLVKTRRYTGQESEREAEEFIVHPNEFKNLRVGEAIIISKYPKSWTKKIQVPEPDVVTVDQEAVQKMLKSIVAIKYIKKGVQNLNLKARVRDQYAKTDLLPSASKTESSKNDNRHITGLSPSADPNF